MPIKMVRIDDRLVHGQIVAAWVKSQGIKRIWVIDEATAHDQFLSGVMKLVAPPDVELVITGEDEIPVRSKEFDEDATNTLVLAKYPYVMQKLFRCHISCNDLNVGGMGANTNRKKLFKNISASEEEIETLREMKKEGVNVYFQVTPDEKQTSFE